MARLGLKVAATNGVRTLKARTPARTVPVLVPMRDEDQQKDHFITRNGLTYAGSHLIIDLWDAERLGDRDHIEQTLIDAVNAAGATLLHIHLHTFTEGGECPALPFSPKAISAFTHGRNAAMRRSTSSCAATQSRARRWTCSRRPSIRAAS